MSEIDQDISLTIDVKKNRLRILKPTMRLLGNPTMVQLLYHPQNKVILVRAAKEQTPGGQELFIHLSKPGGDYEIYSMTFVQKIRKAFPEMQERCSYRLHGTAVEKECMVSFSMSTLEKVDNA